MGTKTMALIQTCQIQAIMTVQKRLFFSAQLSNWNLATCWHVELSMLGPPACLRCFRNIRKTQMSNVYFFLFPWEGFPRQTCNNHLRQKQGCKLIDQI